MARLGPWSACFLLLSLAHPAQSKPPAEDEQEDPEDHRPSPKYKDRTEIDFEDIDVSGGLVMPAGALLMERPMASFAEQMGATPGGAQDVAAFRSWVAAGMVPNGDAMTPEGLFSEHDLPLTARTCERLLCVDAAAVAATLVAQPEVDHIMQLGFVSGLDPSTWRRPPLNVVLVVDLSGSMRGAPIEAVQAAVRAIAGQLDARDQLAIIGFDDAAKLVLAPVSGGRRDAIEAAADRLAADGSTNLIGGLAEGVALARATRRTFDGVTRVVLMTDEQPNVGATDDASFMALARAASADGIGLTTFGIGMSLDARLMAAVAAVRGGNAASFPNAEDVAPRVEADLALLFTELAYDLLIEVMPARGVQIRGVYGVPGGGVQWTSGGIAMSVETVFASKERGGLFLGLEADGSASRGPLATAKVTYTPRDGGPTDSSVDVVIATTPPPAGLVRGPALVDVATTIRAASNLHERGDTDGALALIDEVSARIARVSDPDLDPERDLLRGLRAAMAGPVSARGRDPVSGLPR